jgi:hypothetical protein
LTVNREKGHSISTSKPTPKIEVKAGGKTIASNPAYLGTRAIKLPKIPRMGKNTLVAVNMYLPPGVSQFFIERLDASHIRFVILTEEVNRLAEKAENMMKTQEGITEVKPSERKDLN